MDARLVEIAYRALQFLSEESRKIFRVTELYDQTKASHSRINDFQKLGYWKLFRKVKEKPGFWEITERGWRFLHNDLSVPRRVAVFNRKVVLEDEKMVTVETVLPRWQQEAADFKLDYMRIDYKPEIRQKEMLPFAR